MSRQSSVPDDPPPSAIRQAKRKNSPSTPGPSVGTPEGDVPETTKRVRTTSAKSQSKVQSQNNWPEYFVELYKVFKALNTVLAFCSSRKHLAITFPVVRSSVEALLKKQLEKVVELKALLPDLIRFAYIPRDQLRINAESQGEADKKSKGRGGSPDYSAFTVGSSSAGFSHATPHEDEHVLVLDFAAAKGTGKKPDAPAFAYQLAPSLSPAAVKKLIEKRNQRFEHSVNELLDATPDSDNPAYLIQSAARDHIPVNPNVIKEEDVSETGRTKEVPGPTDRDSIDTILQEIMASEWYKDQIVDRRVFHEKEGRLGTLAVPVSNSIMQALRSSRKISSFYSHQATAIDAIREGKNVIVSTSTASGKSVIYQVPMLRFLEEDPNAKALYIYPTKALAQDQRVALEQLLWSCEGLEHVKVANYDGDTPMEQREGSIRTSSSVIFTNFDMLHASILPHEENWRQFFKALKLVAVDELHYYSGVFGTHVAYIIRRLRRICAAVGNRRIRFVSCSATISNPFQHMKSIFGVDNIEVITDDGAPSGRKDFLIWNPPPNDPMDPTLGRHSTLVESTSLMRFLMKKGVRTILFCKYRKMCELAMKTLRQDLSAEGRHDILKRVMAYRGGDVSNLVYQPAKFMYKLTSTNVIGYSQKDRRKIEHEAFSGNLLGIVATNALELGVDIGALDAVIMLGFPLGIASMRQQAGRAGRRARDALAVLVADSLPLDQYYVQNPNDLFDSNVDDLLIDLDSKVIIEAHLHCAAFEMPLTEEDSAYFGPRLDKICQASLTRDKDGWYHPNPKFLPYPSKHVSIRGIQEDIYTVIDTTDVSQGGSAKLLEEIEVSRAMFEAFEGAVFMHQGMTYIVTEVSHDSRIAKIIRADVNWTTKPRDFTNIDALKTTRIREIKGSTIRAYYGSIELKTVVFGYFKIRNNVILDTVGLEMPPFERNTTGFWIDLPKSTLEILRRKGINAAEAIHSAEHAFLNRFPMSADVGTECKVAVKEYNAADSKRKRPASAGTQGAIAAKAFDHVSDLMHDAFETVESCDCGDGCDKCIRSAFCREHNLVYSRIGAQIVIRGILGLPIDVQAIPEGTSDGVDSIIQADPVRVADGVQVEYYAD
ncbi:DEAD/H helicase [Fomitiporia mediterranea MF3/22]|uniref:DEAD/H helicase n=1 Tax=Fomitiporia mediterranea (strain MF3/22) TaxID=694068 RepID=UPI000440937C|nr:DEAD/H helicase [Fomitiporia mediterranea MF3/22]EJD05721.1 DEAD/H helicase [Fomitiporia mediterranea MF3/22]